MKNTTPMKFSELHIDAARNSTDDFNLFHDKIKWHEIYNNPFEGPIVLGFQLLGLIAEQFIAYRQDNNDYDLIQQHSLNYSYYQLKFASAVKPDKAVELAIKKTQFKTTDTGQTLSNRFSVKADGKLALIGFKKECSEVAFLNEARFDNLPAIHMLQDRSFIENDKYFVKHKFLNTANGKNFLLGCLVEQSKYFNEIENHVTFPEVFPLALSSCALLERAHKLQHDFHLNPMVYLSHQHCIDKRLVSKLKSNTRLTILTETTNAPANDIEAFNCYGLINDNQILFRSELCLMPLDAITR